MIIKSIYTFSRVSIPSELWNNIFLYPFRSLALIKTSAFCIKTEDKGISYSRGIGDLDGL